MARTTKVICDASECQKEALLAEGLPRPSGWILVVNGRNGGRREHEVCGPTCAMKVMQDARVTINKIEFS